MTTTRATVSPRSPAPDATAPVGLQQRLFGPTTAVFGLIAAASAVLDATNLRLPEVVQVIPFAVSVLLFGLPHGALDHLVPARLDPRISIGRSIASVVCLYALLGGITALIWIALPAAGFVLFIAVTWFHWGQGDLWLDRALGRADPSRTDAALTVLVRGALPMLLPLVAHPQDYAAVFTTMTRLLDPDATTSGALLESAPLRVGAAVLITTAVAAHLLVRRRNKSLVAAVEIAVLIAFFTAVPPVLAIGLYFTFWHAVRHIIRLELTTSGSPAELARGDLLRPLARVLRDALPVTLCAIALLAVLAVALRSAGLGTYLLLIAALTTPHTAVVTWMDRRRATASRSPRGTP